MNALSAALIALLFAGCAFGPVPKEAPAIYDLGAPRVDAGTQARLRASLLVHPVAAAAWLETPAIIYRLNYQDAARQLAYANSRWAAAPALLITPRLRGRLAAVSDGGVLAAADGARADYALRVELEDFSHVFDAAEASRAVVVARASLIDTAKRTLLAQRSFRVERAAESANAAGGVRALAAASDEMNEAIVAWVATSLAREKR